MCDELGDMTYMRGFITEMGSPPCSVSDTTKNCETREVDFIAKWLEAPFADVQKELGRLSGMNTGSVKPDLKKWFTQRERLLSQIVAARERPQVVAAAETEF